MKAAVMGYGTIGSGVVEVLNINHDSIAKRAGEAIEVKYVLDLRDFPGDPIQDKIVHDYKVIAEDPEIGMVVETMGGSGTDSRYFKRIHWTIITHTIQSEQNFIISYFTLY